MFRISLVCFAVVSGLAMANETALMRYQKARGDYRIVLMRLDEKERRVLVAFEGGSVRYVEFWRLDYIKTATCKYVFIDGTLKKEEEETAIPEKAAEAEQPAPKAGVVVFGDGKVLRCTVWKMRPDGVTLVSLGRVYTYRGTGIQTIHIGEKAFRYSMLKTGWEEVENPTPPSTEGLVVSFSNPNLWLSPRLAQREQARYMGTYSRPSLGYSFGYYPSNSFGYYPSGLSWSGAKNVHVRSYHRRDGTFVRSHYRSSPRR